MVTQSQLPEINLSLFLISVFLILNSNETPNSNTVKSKLSLHRQNIIKKWSLNFTKYALQITPELWVNKWEIFLS